jgi:putative PIN family toxin of toxin-antitoxin system
MIMRDMRLVLDTSIVVAAMRSPSGASAELVRRVRRGQLIAAATVALCLEYEAVCLRQEHVAAAGASRAEARNFVDAVIGLVVPVEVHFRWRPQLRDASDEMVLEAAVNGAASAIVTFNTRDFLPAAGSFGIAVVRPVDVLKGLS